MSQAYGVAGRLGSLGSRLRIGAVPYRG
ncbi:hypothetical protein BREVUG8_10003 [Brevundimonas sp. G8]|nr:hypothetical protein BREVUG8_10003 [Brevundimonas sp. G8]